MKDFLVIDTEGNDILREIAIIDNRGQLIYEAFAEENYGNDDIKLNLKPLKKILADFLQLSQAKLIIFHNANHDISVLHSSCIQVGLPWRDLKFECSLQLAQKYFETLPSYSLEYLSKQLLLKVNNQYFQNQQAHTARYDAQFTYQLYRKIMEQQTLIKLKNKPNPFGSSRVDNPFQEHIDFQHIYQNEFNLLKNILTEIKSDTNHQSKGVVIIGEQGTGKTHLAMRLAKERLKVNRLLFIRFLNHADHILYQTYTRILDSLVKEVPGTSHTQLEHLLAHSFVKLISRTTILSLTQKDQDILQAVRDNHLNLYRGLGAEGTQKKLDYWKHIEKRANEWWISEYGMAGYSAQIIKGIVKFCSYTDFNRKEIVTRWLAANELDNEDLKLTNLVNWTESITKENFSLEAISVFSRLSLLDEPLIVVFDQLESLGEKHNEKILINFGEAIKEFFTHVPNCLIILNLFPNRWEQFQEVFDGSIIERISQNKIYLEHPSQESLRKILELKVASVDVNLEDLFTEVELENILNNNSIRTVLNSASNYYRYKIHNISLPKAVKSHTSSLYKKSQDNQEVEEKIKLIENKLNQFENLFQEIGKIFSNFSIPLSIPIAEVNPSNFIPHEVINYLEENRKIIEEEYEQIQIISDNNDQGMLQTIAEAFKNIKNISLDHLRLGKKKIPEHLVIQKDNKSLAVAFLNLDSGAFTNYLKNFNELVINNKNTQFQLCRDSRRRSITGQIGRENVEMLNNSVNGKFWILQKHDRIDFELIYKLITDIQNRDFEVDMKEALEMVTSEMATSWVVQIFN